MVSNLVQKVLLNLMPELQIESIIRMTEEAVEACDNFYADIVVNNIDEICKYSYRGKNLAPMYKEARRLADDFEYDRVKEVLTSIADTLQGVTV